jgi:S1-C subfamily serine protease
MRSTKFKALILLGAVLLLSFSLWGIAAAQDDPDATPESTPEAEVETETTSERAFLGVSLEEVDGDVVIREVVAGSAAEEAGLQVDDVITAVNGEEVSGVNDVADAVGALAPGDRVTIDYSRDDESFTVEVTLGSAPEEIDSTRGGDRGGRGGREGQRGQRGQRGFNLLNELGISYNAEDQTWTIESLSENSPLYEAGLREGDVVTAINGEPADPASLIRLLMSGDEDLTLTVERDGEEQEIVISAEDLGLLGMGGMFNFGEGFDLPFGRGRGMMPFQIFGGNGWLGITYLNLDEQVAEEQGVDATEGALVTEVNADSPAEEAGLQVNDVITAVNGEAVDEEHTLRDRLIAYEPDDTVTLDVLRDGETQQIEVTLGEPSGIAGMMPFFHFGQIPDNMIPAAPERGTTTEPNI